MGDIHSRHSILIHSSTNHDTENMRCTYLYTASFIGNIGLYEDGTSSEAGGARTKSGSSLQVDRNEIHFDRTSHTGVCGASREIGTWAAVLLWNAHPASRVADPPIADALRLSLGTIHGRTAWLPDSRVGSVDTA